MSAFSLPSKRVHELLILQPAGGALRKRGASIEDPFLNACITGNISNVAKLAEKNENDRNPYQTPQERNPHQPRHG